MRRGRAGGWLAVGAVSIVANLAFFAAARKFPSSPIGQLKTRIVKG